MPSVALDPAKRSPKMEDHHVHQTQQADGQVKSDPARRRGGIRASSKALYEDCQESHDKPSTLLNPPSAPRMACRQQTSPSWSSRRYAELGNHLIPHLHVRLMHWSLPYPPVRGAGLVLISSKPGVSATSTDGPDAPKFRSVSTQGISYTEAKLCLC